MTVTAGEYLESLAGVPLPTSEQRETFARYAAGAHSWYKHLPVTPPGVPFFFYLDPYAGCADDRTEVDGQKRVVPAELREPSDHYSSMATRDYRHRFGFLAYRAFEAPNIHLPKDDLVRVRDQDVISRRTRTDRLPAEVAELGRVTLTGIVHPRSAWFATARLADSAGTDDVPAWPEESGGAEVLEKVLAAWERMREARSAGDEEAHEAILTEIDVLFAPERARQLAGIIRAIDRVCELVASSPKRGERRPIDRTLE